MTRNDAVRAASLLALLAATACGDASAPPTPAQADVAEVPVELRHLTSTSCQLGRIFQLATQLSPLRRESFDVKASITVALLFKDHQLAVAQRLVFGVATLLNNPVVLDKLRDPNGAAPPTRPEAISELVNLLFECVALPQPGDISGAYGPGGGVTIIPPEGGTAVSNDRAVGVQIPDAAVDETRLIVFAKLTGADAECLPGSGLHQVVDCYKLSSTPNLPFATAVRLVMCSFDEHDGSEHDHARHDRLRIAKTEDDEESTWKVYDRLSDPIGLECEGKEQHAALGNGVLGTLQRFASAVTRPFRPSIAYAADGMGADIFDFSRATVVDPVAFGTGFEVGDPEFTTTEGAFWHRSTLTGIVNGLAVGEGSLVDLAEGDQSGGALPGPLGGSYSLWYGEAGTGNYRGAPYAGAGSIQGGRSAAPNSGSASSPFFAVPNTMNTTSLSFKTWFEIESVNAGPTSGEGVIFDPFDIMDVTVDVQEGASGIQLDRLNPDVNPTAHREPPSRAVASMCRLRSSTTPSTCPRTAVRRSG